MLKERAEPIVSRPIFRSFEISGIRGPMISMDESRTSSCAKPDTSILFCLIFLIVLSGIIKIIKNNLLS